MRGWAKGAVLTTVGGLAVLGVTLWSGEGGKPKRQTPRGGERVASAATKGSGGHPEPARFRVRVLSSHPHDATAYTQGLVWHAGSVYESTGGYGRSSVRQWEVRTGKELRRSHLPPNLFGEGLAVVGRRLIQLTWKEQVALVYRLEDLEASERLTYRGEGWGLCFDGQELIMSDGSAVLSFRDPRTLALRRRMEVSVEDRPVERLNELEWAEGWIFANVWTTDRIVRIDPTNGAVTGSIDASGLLSPEEASRAEVLNGIAYNPETETFLLTGKLWPRIFEVVFEPVH